MSRLQLYFTIFTCLCAAFSSEDASAGDWASNAVNANAVAEAVSALTTLGFPPAASQKCVAALLQENPNLPIEQVIKQALKLL